MAGLVEDDCKMKDYLKGDLTPARELFRIRVMMNDLRGHFKGMVGNKKVNFKCVGCEKEVENNIHVTECPTYSDLRVGKNLSRDEDLLSYFRLVMEARRMKTTSQ